MIEHLSPSGLSKLDHCKRAWAFRYVERREEPPTVPTAVGKIVHRALELLVADGHPRDRHGMRAACGQAWAEREDAWLPDSHKATVWWAASAALGVTALATAVYESTERRIEVAVHGAPLVVVHDWLAQVDGQRTLGDYKSGKWPKPRYRPEKLAENKRQLVLGALALRAVGDEPPAAARVDYLGEGGHRFVCNEYIEPRHIGISLSCYVI